MREGRGWKIFFTYPIVYMNFVSSRAYTTLVINYAAEVRGRLEKSLFIPEIHLPWW